jgi:cyclic pyranopterin phosphate synthase
MPEEGVENLPHEEIMRYEDITFLCRVLLSLGVSKIRFTGGEPLVRRGMIPFLRGFREDFPDAVISITTNASLLKNPAEFAGIGLSSMNVSLDTMNPEKFKEITRGGDLSDVLAGIAAAHDAGVPAIKTNTVLIRGFNDDELHRILSYAWGNGLIPRLIEFMPLSGDLWGSDKFISADDILGLLEVRYGSWRPFDGENSLGFSSAGPAKYYANAQNDVVGVIDAVSNHFCNTCNRLRVSASGGLRACLFGDVVTNLSEALRNRDAPALSEAIVAGMERKPEHWDSSRGGTSRMSGIGG